jgi:hypothetical protein
MSKVRELLDEFKAVFSGRGSRLLDSLVPPLVFLLVNPLMELKYALIGSLAAAVGFAVYRLIKRDSLVYALGGIGGVLLAGVFVFISGSEAGFFLPGLITGGLTVAACVVTVVLNRPLVAWTSFVTRRWPLKWYWHPQVLPAYNEVTMIWGVAFAARLALEYWLFQAGSVNALGASRVFLGWPFTVALLVVSYLYGLWRLRRLRGPSIEEFKAGTAPPWEGQKRGF